MAGAPAELKVGWHPIDPGPRPESRLLDDPPIVDAADLVRAHAAWRAAVEQDERRLDALQAQQPVWHALPKPGPVRVVPVYGGTPRAIDQLVATLALSGVESGYGRVRVVNLLQWNVLSELRGQMQGAKRNSARFDVVSPNGSSVDLFARLAPDELAGLLVDVLRTTSDRQGRRDAVRDKQELLSITRLLDAPVTIARLRDAIDVALGGSPPAAASFSIQEGRALRDHHATVVSQRRGTADRLGDLHGDLSDLATFGASGAVRTEVLGAGEERIRAVEVRAGSSTDGLEQARELLSRAMAQAFSSPSREPEMLVFAGAELLADEVLDALTGAAEHLGKPLVLLFTQMTPAAERVLGYAGSTFALFLRLPNRADAMVAAEHLGREFKFVINGISIADGETSDWSEAYGTSSSTSTSRTTTSSSNRGYGGHALSFGRSVGTSVSKGFDSGTSTTSSTGGSRSSTTTTSAGRVQELVVEPEVFQQLEDEMMFVVSGKTVLLASCRHELRRGQGTAAGTLVVS